MSQFNNDPSQTTASSGAWPTNRDYQPIYQVQLDNLPFTPSSTCIKLKITSPFQPLITSTHLSSSWNWIDAAPLKLTKVRVSTNPLPCSTQHPYTLSVFPPDSIQRVCKECCVKWDKNMLKSGQTGYPIVKFICFKPRRQIDWTIYVLPGEFHISNIPKMCTPKLC